MGQYVDIKLDGRQVAQLRRTAGLTQLELATKAGLSPAYISKLEVSPTMRTAYGTAGKLAHALEVELNTILVDPIPTEIGGTCAFADALLAKCMSSAATLPPEKQAYVGRIMAPLIELAKLECSAA